MPVYTYQCASCGHEYEYFQHYTDDSLTVCPDCETPTLQKVYQVANVHYKGRGWYVKDRYNPDKAG